MEEEDFSKLPLEEQCVHKLWKVRLRAYELAAQLFSQTEEKSPEWSKYNGLIKKFVVDTNAPAQEKACVAVLAYVENCGVAGKTTADVTSALVQKCVAAQKAKTRELASQIILMYIEIEKQEAVMEELVKGTESKNPKIAAACIHIINDALREFGAKVISPSKLIKRVLGHLEDRDKSIRDEAKLLIVEMYRWLGPALKPHLNNLKPLTLGEIEPEFDKIKGTAKPSRLLRSQQSRGVPTAEDQADDDDDGCDDDGEKEPAEVDPYELVDPVDILSQLPKTFYPQLDSKKWSERKESLDALEKILAVSPKLENADYGDLVRTLKKVVAKDSNVVVVGVAIKCITGLANGLKKKFSPYAPVVLVTLFEKFKEKKQNVVVALREAVDAAFVSTSLEQLLEDLIVLLDNKNPSIKAETTSFLVRCFCKSTPAILNKKLLKPLCKSLQKCLADQDPTVRENATQAIGTAMKVVGEKNILPFLGEIDGPKMAKVNEYCEKAEVVAVKQPKPKPSAGSKGKSGSASKTSSSASVRPKVTELKQPIKQIKTETPLVASLNRSDALSKAKSLLSDEVIGNLVSPNDQVRLEALLEIKEMSLKIAPSDDTSQILLTAVCTGGTETNRNILNIKLQIISHVVNSMPLSEEGVRVTIPEILLGLSFNETEEAASEVIHSIMGCMSISDVYEYMFTDLDVTKNPQLMINGLRWASRMDVMKNNDASDWKFLNEIAKSAVSSQDLTLRNAGLALIGSIHLYSEESPAPQRSPQASQVKPMQEKTRGTLPERPVQPLKPRPQSASAAAGKGKVAVVKMFAGSSATITKSKAKPSTNAVRPSDRRRDEDADGSELLKVNNMKMQRLIDEQKFKTLRWNFATPRAEYFELLRDMMTQAGLNKNLIANFFHADFKFHLKAIDSLSEDLNSNLQGLICNLDLILKWMTLRFFDTNTSVISRGLEYLISAFVMLANERYSMVDHEASSFIPYLILKAGDAKETTQKSVKELFVKLSNVYPPNKVSTFVVDGMKSKNSRQRMVCLEIMLNFIETFGVSECYPSLPNFTNVILGFLRDRDQAVRNMAFKIMVSVYLQEGDAFIAAVNQNLGKEAPALITKLKNSARNRPVASVRPMSSPGDTVVVSESHLEDEGTEDDDEEQVSPVRNDVRISPAASLPPSYSQSPPRVPVSPRSPETTNYKYELDKNILELMDCAPSVVQPPNITDIDLQFLKDGNTPPAVRAIQMPKVTSTLSNYVHMSSIKFEIVQIASSDIEKAISSMSHIESLLTSEKRTQVLSYVDNIVTQIVHQLIILSQSAHPEVVNCYHSIFAVMFQICHHQDSCVQIRESTLQKILEQFLLLLTEKKMENLEKYEMFVRVVNSTVIHMLTNANKTRVLCAVIKLLFNTVDNPTLSKHYQELIVKCVWKLNRAQPQWDSELDYSRVLMEFHNFLKDHPSVWWKTQPADVPLRAVKTLLHTMVRLRGSQVKEIIAQQNIPEDSELGAYVKKLIKHLKIEDSPSNVNASIVKEEPKPTQTRTAPRLTKEAQEELSQIFRMIGDTEESSEGIRRLSVFKKTHPEADVQPFLSKSTSVFQQYIKKGLDSLENQSDQPVKVKKSDFSGDDCNKQSENKEEFAQEAQRLWSRLSKLQEKAGCNSPKKVDTNRTADPQNDLKEFDLR